MAEKFDEFKNHVENQFGCTLKNVRSDNGGECIGQAFQNIYKGGIVHKFTTSYTL